MAKTKTKTRTITRTIVKRAKSGAKGVLTGKNLQKIAVRAGIGTAAGLATTFVMSKLAPDFADEAGIITASLAGGAPGTIVWTLLGRRLTAAVQGAFGQSPLLGAGQQVGL